MDRKEAQRRKIGAERSPFKLPFMSHRRKFNAQSSDRGYNDDYIDVKEELDRIGHNLTSVLNNPRESVIDMLYDAFDTEQSCSIESYIDGTQTMPAEIDMGEVVTFFNRTSHLSRPFTACHDMKWGANQDFSRSSRKFSTASIDSDSSYSINSPIPLHRTNVHAPSSVSPASHSFSPDEDFLSKIQSPALQAELKRCFDEVPSIFFQQDFNLHEPTVFEKLVNNPGPQQQERLSHFLDLVEVSLLGQISIRSDTFLEGLETTHILRNVVSEACSSVNDLRKSMMRIDNEVVKKAIHVPQLAQKQQNLMALQKHLDVILNLKRSKQAIEPLLAAQDYSSAIHILETSNQMLDTNISDLSCLRDARRQMRELEEVSFVMLSSRFISLGQKIGPNLGEDVPNLTSELEYVISAVERLGRLDFLLHMFNERLQDDLKLVIKTVVSDYLITSDSSGALLDVYTPLNDMDQIELQGRKLRTLEHSAFLSCLMLCFEHVIVVLERAASMHHYIVSRSICRNGSDNPEQVHRNGSKSEFDNRHDRHVEESICTLEGLKNAAHFVEQSLSQLLTVRTEYHTMYVTSEQLKSICKASLDFTVKVEEICGSVGSKLRMILMNQTKSFVENRYEKNKSELMMALEAERWTQVDVSPDRQMLLNHIVGGQALSQSSLNMSISAQHANAKNAITRSKENKREALINGRLYKIVWSTVLLNEIIFHQLRIASNFPSAATDVLGRLSELLRLFNSRTKQLVLGAGALHSASKLRSITAKHLALCAHSLSLVRAIIPHLRAAFLVHLPKKHDLLLVELERVSQEYEEHHDLILVKFVNIVQEVIESARSVLREENWDRIDDNTNTNFNVSTDQPKFMTKIVESVIQMHKVLNVYLPPEEFKDVFSRIFSLLSRKIPECFVREGVEPKTASGRQRIIDDTSFMTTKLTALYGVDCSNLHLEEELLAKYGPNLDSKVTS